MIQHKLSWLLKQNVMHPERRAQSCACITGRRLNKHVVERSLAQDATVGDTVEHYAARDAQLCQSSALVKMIGHLQKNFFSRALNTGGDVRVFLVFFSYAIVPLRM